MNSRVGHLALRTWLVRCRRWFFRAVVVLLALPLAYLTLALVGLLAVNRDYRPPAQDGIDIYVVHNDVHTDILVPTVSAECDWRTWFPAQDFGASQPIASFVQMGWGDRQFYVETPTWADLKLMPTLRAALLPSETVMHVEYTSQPIESPRCRRVRLSGPQYARLVEHLQNSFHRTESGKPSRIVGAAYHQYDAFYQARGSYHLFNTCNCWTGRMLRAAGVRIGCWTPFPQSVLETLPTAIPPRPAEPHAPDARRPPRQAFRP